MKIKHIFEVYEKLKIDLLDCESLKTIPASILPSLLKITETKNAEDFVEQYKYCMLPPFVQNKKEKKEDGKKITIYDLSVIAGASGAPNYKDFYLWELLAFSKGKNSFSWGLCSSVLALINNAHCTKKSDIKKPEDFNPTITEEEKAEKRKKNSIPLESVL